MKAQIAKHDDIFEKYNFTAITDFMREKLASIPEWYKTSSLSQKKVLISSIFPSGVPWSYPGCSNYDISLLYQQIRAFSDTQVASGAAGETRTLTTIIVEGS